MYQMEIKDRIALHQSSAECSTGITEGATILYSKRPKLRCPCRAVTVIQGFHTFRQTLIQQLAFLQHKSQVWNFPSFHVDCYCKSLQGTSLSEKGEGWSIFCNVTLEQSKLS